MAGPRSPGGTRKLPMREVIALPNLLTLANAFCGLLALSKGIDALALDPSSVLFYTKMEAAAWLIF